MRITKKERFILVSNTSSISELMKAKNYQFNPVPDRHHDFSSFKWTSGMKLPDKCTPETDLHWIRRYDDENMVLVALLGSHSDWSQKYIQADQYFCNLCGKTNWNTPQYMVQPDLVPDQICQDPLNRKPCICGVQSCEVAGEPPRQSASAAAAVPQQSASAAAAVPQQSSSPADSSFLSAGGFMGSNIRNWGESGAMKRQWESDQPVTILPWKDLGPINEDAAYLNPVPIKAGCPKCPFDVVSALKGQIVQREYVQAYTYWIRDWFSASSHDPRKLLCIL